MDIGHWQYHENIPKECFGFIYQITEIYTNRKYVGKKQIRKIIKRPPLKGKKNKRHVISESDWKTYTGSCNSLNEQIIEHGKSGFKFEVLKLCRSKWELAYEEAKLQFELDVLCKDEYYNGIIHCRIGKKPLDRSS